MEGVKEKMTSSLFPDHDCRDYIIYNVGGEYTCQHESHGFSDGVYFFTDLGFTVEELLNEYYPDWNKPNGKEYGFDIEMKEYFDECVKNGIHYHKLEIKNESVQ